MAERKTRSRTLTVSDEEWNRLAALAAAEQRTITRQVMHMAESRIADLSANAASRESFEGELERINAESV